MDKQIISFSHVRLTLLDTTHRLAFVPSISVEAKPANGLDNNGFNNLDFILGLFRLGAKWASVKTNWFGLGSSTQQFGANWVPI